MFDQMEALRALEETGTTARAAARLRITQSAVSKRISALEATLGVAVVEKRGRSLVLTPAGASVLADLEPHLRAIRSRVRTLAPGGGTLRVAATESLLAAWLPAALAEARVAAGVELELHAHRGPLVVERVLGGHADVGICVPGEEGTLASEPLGDEPMVLVPSGTEPLVVPPTAPLDVWTIEARSLTGAWLDRRLARHPWPIRPTRRIESFSAAVQLARAGFGPALVPEGLARAMGVPATAAVVVPGLRRPLVAVYETSAGDRPAVRRFVDALRGAAIKALAAANVAPG